MAEHEAALARIDERFDRAVAKLGELDRLLLVRHDYIERLEQAVLETWRGSDHPGLKRDYWCWHCRRTSADINGVEHAEDCLVPALIAKHETP